MRNIAVNQDPAVAAVETREWQESLDYVVQKGGGVARAAELLRQLEFHARQSRLPPAVFRRTPRTSTPSRRRSSRPFPATRRSSGASRASSAGTRLSMVVRANKQSDGIGGHISTFASAATLYEIGLQPLLQGRGTGFDGDVIFFQGHAAPGIYSRAFLEGRLTVEAPRELPPRAAGRRRPLVVPASLADARLLGIPDGLDGPRAHHGDLPGALHAPPRRPRPGADAAIARSGRSSATARPTSPRRSARSRWPSARSSTT